MRSGMPSAFALVNGEGVVCYYTHSRVIAQRVANEKGWTFIVIKPIEEMEEK